MSKSFQQFTCLGHVGEDPKYRITSKGGRSARFRVATTHSVKTSGNARQRRTEWHRIICWDGLADIVQRHLHKGDEVHVIGHIEYRSYDDKDGHTFHLAEVIARDVIVLSPDGAGGPVPDDRGDPVDLPDEDSLE